MNENGEPMRSICSIEINEIVLNSTIGRILGDVLQNIHFSGFKR